MTFNIGVIGLGAIGERLIKAFGAHSETTVKAVCDTVQGRAGAIAEKLGGISSYINHKDMLENEQLDLVYVAVPPKYHYQVVMDVIQSGSNILCEKPLANSLEEAKEMYEKVVQAGVLHAMNFPLNYESGPNTFIKLLQDNYVGKIRKVELTLHFPAWPRKWQQNEWVAGREQGGFVLEVGVHFIQLTQRIFGSIQNIQSTLELPNDKDKCETGVFAVAELVDGVPFILNGISQVAGDERLAYTVYGTEGTLSLINWSQVEGGKTGGKIEPKPSTDHLTLSLIDNLVAALKGKENQLYTFKDGYEAQLVLEQLRQKNE